MEAIKPIKIRAIKAEDLTDEEFNAIMNARVPEEYEGLEKAAQSESELSSKDNSSP